MLRCANKFSLRSFVSNANYQQLNRKQLNCCSINIYDALRVYSNSMKLITIPANTASSAKVCHKSCVKVALTEVCQKLDSRGESIEIFLTYLLPDNIDN